MNQQDYLDEILWAVTGEVYGRALFQTIAETAEDDAVVGKCLVLAGLEAATLGQLQMLVAKYSLTYDEDAHVQRGQDNAAKIIERGWAKTMELFHDVVGDDVARMERLLEAAPEDDKFALAFLVNHEKALAFFVEKELAGGLDSLSEAHKLLQAP